MRRRVWWILGAALLAASVPLGWLGYARVRESQRTSEFVGAVYSGDVGRVRAMLDHGGNANGANMSGFTPLIRAVTVPPQLVNPKMIELLLERGADPNVQDERGETALDVAVADGLPPEVIRGLVRHGAKRGKELR